jgi:hypothetical protein
VGPNNLILTNFKEEDMRKLAMGIIVVVAISMLFVQVSFAQKSQAASAGVSRGAWTLGIPAETLTGFLGTEAIVVESGKVMKVEPMKGVKGGLQMKFKTEMGQVQGLKGENVYTVFMGPKWFVENQKLKFMAGDSVMVRGKKFGSYIVASEISKGDWTMKLRNEEDGQPSWDCCFPGQVKSLK